MAWFCSLERRAQQKVVFGLTQMTKTVRLFSIYVHVLLYFRTGFLSFSGGIFQILVRKTIQDLLRHLWLVVVVVVLLKSLKWFRFFSHFLINMDTPFPFLLECWSDQNHNSRTSDLFILWIYLWAPSFITYGNRRMRRNEFRRSFFSCSKSGAWLNFPSICICV